MNIQSRSSRIAERMERWKAFLAPDAEPGLMFQVNYVDPEADLPPVPPKWPDHKQERIEWAWKQYCHQLEQSQWLDDDRVPCLNNLTGTEIFAEALGCNVQRPVGMMPFALPCVQSAADAEKIRVPDIGSSTLSYLFDIADELQRRAGPDAAQRLVDVQSPMDVAALVWAKESFFAAMIESPDAVKELAAKARELMIAFFDEWFARYGTDYVAHHPDYFMSGGITLSEDEIGAVSAEMFHEFFRPELVNLSDRYGGIGIHCCADAKHQWAGLRGVQGLRLLNLVNPTTRTGEEYVKEAYPFFADVCAQMHFRWTPEGPPDTWPSQLPSNTRIVYRLAAETRDEAKRLCNAFQQLRRRS